jgi:hypothetical protein
MGEEHVTTQPEGGHGGHGEHGGHGGHAHGSPFTAEELAELQKSDVGAGAAVIVLMAGIFSIGLVLYSVIAFIVAG